MSGTHSPSVDSLAPRTFQGRLTLAFVAVVTVTLGLVGLLVVNRLGAYFDQQQQDDLAARARGVAQYVILIAEGTGSIRAGRPVVTAEGEVDPVVVVELSKDSQQRIIADRLAQADVRYRIGTMSGPAFEVAASGTFDALNHAPREPRQERESLASNPIVETNDSAPIPYAVEVTLLNPYTYRAAAIQNVTGLLAITGLIALAVAVVVAAMLTRRITTPLRRLTEASRDLAEGDFARRVPADAIEDGPIELAELGLQFNAMAERLQQSVEIIRRDRDRSREFLADVSHAQSVQARRPLSHA
ncbi:MAG: HAMP domain-containing protein [Chloroflexi bacterium]|nr:HAMP domain-containing protein [Chloroflexota bacterium]